MKKLLSIITCVAIVISMMSMLTVSADTLPTFTKDYYVVNVLESAESTLTNTTTDGHVELSDGWMGPSDKGDTIDLGNGETLDKHYYTHSANLTATYTFTNIPAGNYEIQYHVSHGNSYYYFPLELTYNGETVSTTLGSTSSTTNLSQAWHSVSTFTKNDDISDVVVKLITPDVAYASYQNIRTSAVRLKNLEERSSYVIRNTAANAASSSNGTFEISGSWKDGSKGYTLDSVSGKQINSTTLGAYVKYNFINSDTPISIFGNDNYTGIEPGYYDVYFYYPQANSTDDPAAVFEVGHNGTTTSFTKAMYTDFKGAAWTLVSDRTAPLYFTGDGSEYVKISNGTAGKYTRVGAIKLLKKNIIESAPEVEIKDLVSSPTYNNGNLTVVTNGSTVETGSKTVYALVASYTNSGEVLAGVKTTPIIVVAGADDATVPVVLPAVSGTSYKLFILDSLANVKPLIGSFDF